MSLQTPVRGTSLVQQTQDILTERIRQGLYQPATQIPPENELAIEFNVSRATVRSAISALVERGLVVRRHGVGTFVSQRSRLTNTLNEAIDFNEMIAKNGFQPGVQHISTQQLLPEAHLAAALQITKTQPVLQEYKVFTADEIPVIYCLTVMPTWMFDEVTIHQILANPEITEPLYKFVEQCCQQQIDHFVAKVQAEVAENCQFPQLTLATGTPILVIEEVAYNSQEIPLWYSLEYYPNDNKMTFELIRRRGRS